MRRAVPAVLVLVVLGLFWAGQHVRGQLPLQVALGSAAAFERSLQAIREWVQTLGWLGPSIFIGLVAFRQFLLLPSGVVLTVGGLAFGIVLGTILGSIGIAISALLGFSVARGAGRRLVRSSFGPRYRAFERRIERAGVWLVALLTAHPAAPMTTVHVAAGLTSIAALSFLLAVLAAGLLRAGMYATLGSSMVDIGMGWSALIGLVLVLLGAAPLVHHRSRAWILPARADDADLASEDRDPDAPR